MPTATDQSSTPTDHAQDDPDRSSDKAQTRDWVQVLRRTKEQVQEDRVGLMAAGMAFYAMLAVVPAMIAAITIWGLVSDPAQIRATIADAADALPNGAAQLLQDQMTRIAEGSGSALGWTLAVALLGALWSASSGTKGMVAAITAAYNEDDSRGFLKLRGLALGLTFGGIIFGLFVIGLVVVVPGVLGLVGLGDIAATSIRWLRWPVLLAAIVLGLTVLYQVAPTRDRVPWRWISWGSGAATTLWIIASAGFALYVNNFGTFGETYGSLSGVIVLMLWFFLTSFAILLGAELNAEIERQASDRNTSS